MDSIPVLTQLSNIFFISVRIAVFFISAPMFGSNAVKTSIRMSIAFMISYLLYKASYVTPVTDLSSMYVISLILIQEVLVGLIFTFVSQFIYFPLRVAGVEIGQAAGFGQGEIINPDDEDQFTILQQFMYIIGILIFFGLDGHHLIVKIIAESFTFIPIGGIILNPKIADVTFRYFSDSFNQGVIFAAPVLGCILISSMSFGILSKSMPQMNLLIIDLPIRIIIGFLGLAFMMPMLAWVFKKFIYKTAMVYEILIKLMSGA